MLVLVFSHTQSYSYIVRDASKQFVGRASVLPKELADLEGTLLLILHDPNLSPGGTISCEKLEQIENKCDVSLLQWIMWQSCHVLQWIER